MKYTPEVYRLLTKAMKNSERRLENSAKGVNADELELTRKIIADLKVRRAAAVEAEKKAGK